MQNELLRYCQAKRKHEDGRRSLEEGQRREVDREETAAGANKSLMGSTKIAPFN